MNYLKHFLLGSIFFAISSALAAQTSAISGRVLSEYGETIPYANVYLTDQNWTVSDENGSFLIQSIPAGTYDLKVSSIGFETFTSELSLIGSDTTFLDVVLTEFTYQTSPAVVTATRSAQDIENVPISVDVISSNEIQSSGSTSLKDILLEQAAISLSPNEENAIQIQGFESDYTLILVNGQPLIGRVRGALDVSRINVANIEQVEIVKGPSSALWGSDALAGVINIITKTPDEPFSGVTYLEAGSRTSYDGGATVSFSQTRFSGTAGVSFDGSEGFDIDDSEFGNNQNPYDNISLNTSLRYDLSELSSISLSGRYFKNSFQGLTIASVQGQTIGIEEDGWQDDLSFQLNFETSPFSRFNTTATLYTTRYEDYSETFFEDQTQDDIINNNLQGYDKIELQNDYIWLNNHISTFGGGFTSEFVNAERYQGRRNQSGSFIYGQHQFLFTEKMNFTLGARLDNHSSYNSYLSPKASLKYDLSDSFSFRASLGKGFKAPDFRTLYLNFDNSGSGYRLFGVNNIGAELDSFENQGLVDRYLVDSGSISSLDPEYSTAYNVGFSFNTPTHSYQAKVNFFHNNARNLIEAIEVAELSDGSSVYGYVNINKARTRGIEADQTIHFSPDFSFSFGYQYLNAVQLVTESRTIIENGNVVTKDFESSEPLPKRPLHSGSLKFFYKEPFFDTEISLRGILKSGYFFNDRNANGEADSNEYTDAYTLWNLTLTKRLSGSMRAQIGANNLFNYTNPEFFRYQPGSTFFTKIYFEF